MVCMKSLLYAIFLRASVTRACTGNNGLWWALVVQLVGLEADPEI